MLKSNSHNDEAQREIPRKTPREDQKEMHLPDVDADTDDPDFHQEEAERRKWLREMRSLDAIRKSMSAKHREYSREH
ncbi:hypothetical protein [Undibacterium sp. TJN19]|uniref:hypothetical protein n=1 Tax=Undibacterium sp. TJN19 TaxID=3413055 RepID=UPI003BF042D2